MYETIREYGFEQLEVSGEADEAHQRHAGFFLALAREAEPAMTGPGLREWLERLEAEHDNLRSAITWTLEHEPGTALHLAANLWRFWYTRGHFEEGRGWLGRALAEGSATPARERALQGASTLAWVQGDLLGANSRAEEALAMFRAIGDQDGVAHALNALGDAVLMSGEESFEWAALGDAVLPSAKESFERAAAAYGEALGLFRDQGNQRGIAGVLTNLGNLAWERGDHDRATDLHREALALYRKIGNERGVA